MILKRGAEYTPVIFQHASLQNKKFVEIKQDNNSYVRLTTESGYKIVLGDFITYFRPRIDRLQKSYYYSNGVLFDNCNRIIAIVVEKNEDKYIIVEEDFSKIWPTYFSRIKKSSNELGISTRSKLMLWSESKLYSEFQEVINPTMEDYLPENQLILSSEFINAKRVERNLVENE